MIAEQRRGSFGGVTRDTINGVISGIDRKFVGQVRCRLRLLPRSTRLGAAITTCAGWAPSTISTARAAIVVASSIATVNGLLRNAIRSSILDRQQGRANDHE
jgi:hypothetical protein